MSVTNVPTSARTNARHNCTSIETEKTMSSIIKTSTSLVSILDRAVLSIMLIPTNIIGKANTQMMSPLQKFKMMIPLQKFKKIVDNRLKFVDVSDEMVREVDALCTANLTLSPLKCSDSIRQSMDLKYPSGWAGKKKSFITDWVRLTRYNLNHRDKFRTFRTPATG